MEYNIFSSSWRPNEKQRNERRGGRIEGGWNSERGRDGKLGQVT